MFSEELCAHGKQRRVFWSQCVKRRYLAYLILVKDYRVASTSRDDQMVNIRRLKHLADAKTDKMLSVAPNELGSEQKLMNCVALDEIYNLAG
jgi:GDP-D-mannose dehydratase